MSGVFEPEIVGMDKRIDICPFCKKPARLFTNRLWWKDYGYIGNYRYYVGCDNPSCKVRPRTKSYNDIYVETEVAIREAIKDWNWIPKE